MNISKRFQALKEAHANFWKQRLNEERDNVSRWGERAVKEYHEGHIETARLAAKFHRKAVVKLREYEKILKDYETKTR